MENNIEKVNLRFIHLHISAFDGHELELRPDVSPPGTPLWSTTFSNKPFPLVDCEHHGARNPWSEVAVSGLITTCICWLTRSSPLRAS